MSEGHDGKGGWAGLTLGTGGGGLVEGKGVGG